MRLKYLDNEIKNRLLTRLSEDIDRERTDERWVKHLIKANEWDGICTVECCQGHSRFHASNFRGYISLLFSAEKQKIFNKEIEWLLGTYPVATVRKCFTTSNLGEAYGQRFWAKGYCCLNEIVFEKYAFKEFIEDCFIPLLEKLNGKQA